MALPLQSRTSLVTGGGRGIGRATALALAEADASVAVLARSAKEVDRTVGELRGQDIEPPGHRVTSASPPRWPTRCTGRPGNWATSTSWSTTLG